MASKIQQIQKTALDFFEMHFPIRGKVLEIGSDMDCAVALHLQERGCEVTALNPSKYFDPPAGISALKDDARDMKSIADGTFDCVVTVNTFEHVHALHVALAEIHRVIRPGGHLGALFGPLWSSAQGHHLWAKHGDDIVSFWNPNFRNPVDDYAHLLLTPNEMRADLTAKGEMPSMIEQIINAVYMRDDTNRWMYGHYIKALEDMPLKIVKLEPNNKFIVPPGIEPKLKMRWGDHDFGVSSLRLAAVRDDR